MNNDSNGSQPNIVPFGKYKGQPIEVLAGDPKYVEWLNGQGWVKDRHPQFYTVIINNFQEPSDTPEHNALQALFLDDALCMRFLFTVDGRVGEESRFLFLKSKEFEIEGIDVRLAYDAWRLSDYAENERRHGMIFGKEDIERMTYPFFSCGIEIKPSLGDDFPSVLRQVRNMSFSKRGLDHRCVLFRDFTATSVTLDQVREMFALSGVLLFSLDEVQQAEPELIFNEWKISIPKDDI